MSLEQKALLFIPDISGFTEFVHYTEISHSKHIISELLEVLLDANSMELQLAEIEGDALFFYKLEEVVNQNQLQKQIEQMYIAFHTHLKRYEYERICHCGACSSAYNLSLKFITHHGIIDFISVKDSVKPYGSTVIQAHRLLKNEIPISEYALFTENVLQIRDNARNRMTTSYDFGDLEFTYNDLLEFKEHLPYVAPIPQDIPRHKLFSISKTVIIPKLDLYEIISNFDYRLLWVKGVDALEYEKNKVNRAGTKHQCLFDKNDNIDQTTVSKEIEPHQLVYGESTQEAPLTRKLNVYYVIEEEDEERTKLSIEAYADFKFLGILIKPILSKKLKSNVVENIEELIKLIDSGFTVKNAEKNKS